MGQEISTTHFKHYDFHRFDKLVEREMELLRSWFREERFSAKRSFSRSSEMNGLMALVHADDAITLSRCAAPLIRELNGRYVQASSQWHPGLRDRFAPPRDRPKYCGSALSSKCGRVSPE